MNNSVIVSIFHFFQDIKVMPGCVVDGCNKGNNGRQIGYQTFPFPKISDELLRQKWIDEIDRENWIPSDHSRVCSRHFDETAFDNNKR